jgi:CheY-like chemotaxis protein
MALYQRLTMRPDHGTGGTIMAKQTLVLLVPGDRLTGVLTESGLQGFGYDVLMVRDPDEALDLLRTAGRIDVLVVDADLPNNAGLALAKAARSLNPKYKVIYTSRNPFQIPDREKVRGAPWLRTPYHPHQLVGLISNLSGRLGSDCEIQAA